MNFENFQDFFRKSERWYPKSTSYDLFVHLWDSQNGQNIGDPTNPDPDYFFMKIWKIWNIQFWGLLGRWRSILMIFPIFQDFFRKNETRYPKSTSYDLFIYLRGRQNAQNIEHPTIPTPDYFFLKNLKIAKIPYLGRLGVWRGFSLFCRIFRRRDGKLSCDGQNRLPTIF